MALRRRKFGTEVASWDFRVRTRGGRTKRVRARVGRQYKVSDRDWACPVEIRGFESRYPDISGVGSMQALCLATGLIRMRIEDILSKGGAVLEIDDDSKWDLRAVRATFGASLSGTPHNKPLQPDGRVGRSAPSRTRR
jgi:hypothetical protein